MKKIVFLIALFLINTGAILPQIQEEKEKVKKEQVITNQTLRELKVNISIMGKEEESKEEEKVGPEESPQSEVKDEKYWRNLKREIEERISQAEKRMANLKEEINALYRDFYSIDDPGRREQIQVRIVEETRKMEEAEKDLEKAKKDFEKFLERARKEGALPGWLR